MKRIILLLLGAVLLVGCERRMANINTTVNSPIEGLKQVTIEGCQYLVVENGAVGFNNYSLTLTHKGNCANEIHKGR